MRKFHIFGKFHSDTTIFDENWNVFFTVASGSEAERESNVGILMEKIGFFIGGTVCFNHDLYVIEYDDERKIYKFKADNGNIISFVDGRFS
jgi:hypothetical protein